MNDQNPEHPSADNAAFDHATPPQQPVVMSGQPISAPNPPYQPAQVSGNAGMVGTLTIVSGVCYALWFPLVFLWGLGLLVALAGAVCLLISFIFGLIGHYRVWNSIQDGQQRTNPGFAVGFLFIPFFNFYWMFVSYVGLAKNLRAYGERHNINVPPVSEGLATTTCILGICTTLAAIPVLGGFILAAWIICWGIMIQSFLRAGAAIAEARLNGQGHAPA